MPCILKIKVISARDLPIMDKASELTDAYVEIKFGEHHLARTQIAKKTLDPVWNEDFRFEITDDADIQNEFLEIRVLDYDAISSNDMVGAVSIDLDPLLTWDLEPMDEENIEPQLTGWFPLYDTLQGIRGEIHLQVKLYFFGDINPFKDSSAGVKIFASTELPPMYRVEHIYGLVKSLINEDDPEYHWSDSFRTPRYSNEVRQKLLYRLSGQLKRLVGKEVLEMGGNAVIGYKQSFDLEKEECVITARCIGTCVKLSIVEASLDSHDVNEGIIETSEETSPVNLTSREPTSEMSPRYPANTAESMVSAQRKYSKGETNQPIVPEQALITISKFHPGAIRSIGGVVSARSVKLLENGETSVRHAWWNEIREEIKSHAKTLGCWLVIGYTEKSYIHDQLCVLSAMGTAVKVDIKNWLRPDVDFISKNVPKCSGCHVPYNKKMVPFPMNFTKCLICKKKYVPEILFCNIELLEELETVGDGYYIEAHVCRTKKRKEGDTNATIVSEILPFLEYDIHRQLLYKLKVQGLNAIFGLSIHLAIGDGVIVAVASGTATFLAALPPPPSLKISRNLDVLDAEDRTLLEIQKKITELSESNRRRLESARIKKFLEMGIEIDMSSANLDDESELRSSRRRTIIESPALSSKNFMMSAQRRVLNEESSQSSDSENDDFVQISTSVIQIDDNTDEDLMTVLLDPKYPEIFQLSNTQTIPINDDISSPLYKIKNFLKNNYVLDDAIYSTQMITVVKKGSINAVLHHPNRHLASIFKELYEELQLSLSYFKYFVVSGISLNIQLVQDHDLHIRLTALATGQFSMENDFPQSLITADKENDELSVAKMEKLYLENKDNIVRGRIQITKLESSSSVSMLHTASPMEEPASSKVFNKSDSIFQHHRQTFIEITPLNNPTLGNISKHLGRISLYFVKEELNLHHNHGNHYSDSANYIENTHDDGLGTFIHKFLMEVQAIVRSRAVSMGGNAVVAFCIENSLFRETLKNQAYGLVCVSGDVVEIKSNDLKFFSPVIKGDEMVYNLFLSSRRQNRKGEFSKEI
jgi:uncharacterized protein YbjQ (UPF0145 family)